MRDPQSEARRWLDAAREDLAYARHAAAGGYHAPACFYAQQVAEKSVKAVHYLRGARAVLGHNVRALIEQLDPVPPAFAALLDAARELDLLYVPMRYPNGLDAGTPARAFSQVHSGRASELGERFVTAAAGALA
jgi:HEPN domain-containing protein